MIKKLTMKKFVTTFFAMSLLAGLFLATPSSVSAQYVEGVEDLEENASYPLVDEPAPQTFTAPQINQPLAMAADQNGYIYISNEYQIPTILRLESGGAGQNDALSGQLNVFQFSPDLTALNYVTSISIPETEPAGFSGAIFDPIEEIWTELCAVLPTDEDQLTALYAQSPTLQALLIARKLSLGETIGDEATEDEVTEDGDTEDGDTEEEEEEPQIDEELLATQIQQFQSLSAECQPFVTDCLYASSVTNPPPATDTTTDETEATTDCLLDRCSEEAESVRGTVTPDALSEECIKSTPYVSTAIDHFTPENFLRSESDSTNPQVWKPQLQNVTTIHVDNSGALYIGEHTISRTAYNPDSTTSLVIGQNRLIVAEPSGSNPSQGYSNYFATAIDSTQYGTIADIATDSSGAIYVATAGTATEDSSILIYRRSGNSLELIGDFQFSDIETISSLAFGMSPQSQNLLLATAIADTTEGDSRNTIVTFRASAPGLLVEETIHADDFSFLHNNCREEQFVSILDSQGRTRVRRGTFTFTELTGIALDQADNIYVVDSGQQDCSNILTLAPNTPGDSTSKYLPASALGSRPVLLRSSAFPGQELDALTATSIDKDPKLNIAGEARVDIHIDESRNLIYVLEASGTSGQKGIKVVPTGQAQLRSGWNLVNWGGSDEADSDDFIFPGITTASELAAYVGQANVNSIWSWDESSQTFATWPGGGLDSLEGSDQLFIDMRVGGRYLPYVTQDSAPKNPLIFPGWSLITYRGTDIAEPEAAEEIDASTLCRTTVPVEAPAEEEATTEGGTEEEAETEAAEEEVVEEVVEMLPLCSEFCPTDGSTIPADCFNFCLDTAPEADADAENTNTIPLCSALCSQNLSPVPTICYIASGTTPEKIELPLASCLVNFVDLQNNGDSIAAILWWDASSQEWNRGYYPNQPGFAPPGVTVVQADATGISYDDTIFVNLNSPSGNVYTGAWRDSCTS